MVKVIKRNINMMQGTEGPKHDPYGWTECIMNTEYDNGTGDFVSVHMGLAEYFEMGGIKFELQGKNGLAHNDMFEDLMSMTVNEFCCMIDNLYHENWEPDPMGCLADYE